MGEAVEAGEMLALPVASLHLAQEGVGAEEAGEQLSFSALHQIDLPSCTPCCSRDGFLCVCLGFGPKTRKGLGELLLYYLHCFNVTRQH